MGLSLNPADAFKLFFERNDRSVARTIAYMESVVTAARHLSEVWHSTYKQLAANSSVTLIPDGVMGWNISPYRQLEEFYRVTTSVLLKHPDLNRAFMDGLANLLVQRTITKRAYEGVVARSRGSLFLSDQNAAVDLTDVRKGVEALAALVVPPAGDGNSAQSMDLRFA